MNETPLFAAEDTDEDEEGGEGEEDADSNATSDTEPNSEPDSVDDEDDEDEEGMGTNYSDLVSALHIQKCNQFYVHVKVSFLPPAITIWSFLEEKKYIPPLLNRI